MMRCSVALCTYNGARYLPAQLESIATQSRRPDELVACDDASTDGSQEILRRFAVQAPFPVRFYPNAENIGVTRNFEQAIRLCDGDWIALSDQDDVWSPSKLEVLESALSGADARAAVFTDADVVDESLRPLGYTLWDAIEFDRRRRVVARRGRLLDVLLWRNVVTGATLAFRSDVRDLVLPIPDLWMHDAWLALILAAHGWVMPLGTRTIRYRQHLNNRVGAQRPTFAALLRRLLASPRSSYLLQHRQLEAARDRLERAANAASAPVPREALTRITRKIAHLEARGRMPAARWRRIPIVARELAAMNYRAFSSGWWSAVADLALPAVARPPAP